MKLIFPDGKLRTCLVPVAGFLNHSICPHIMHYVRIDATTNSVIFSLSRPCRSGEQCFLSYGNLSNSHLLTFYGFLPRGENPFDVIPLDIDVASPSEWNPHMVRGTWLSKNHTIFYYGLPSPLLNRLRGARILVHRLKTHGGVAAIIQRPHLMVSEQMGLPNTFESYSRTESDNGSSNSDGEQSSDGASSPLKDVCQPMKEGKTNASPPIRPNNIGHKFKLA